MQAQINVMGLESIHTVDMVIRLPGEPLRGALILYDDGGIHDVRARDAALDAKLLAYLKFVTSGQLAASFPQFSGVEIFIKVVCRATPTSHMREIEGVHDTGGTFLPIQVMTEAEFTSRLS
jgi:hypothetical protein